MLCLLESWWRTSTAIVSSSAPTFLFYLQSVAVMCAVARAVMHGLCRVGYAPCWSKCGCQQTALRAGTKSLQHQQACIQQSYINPGLAWMSGIAGTVPDKM